MAHELERLTGFLLDLCGGDGGPGLRAAMRCPLCAGPVTCRIDRNASILTCSCISVPDHYRWHGNFLRLPGWLRSDESTP
jgi:hypothetical protein